MNYRSGLGVLVLGIAFIMGAYMAVQQGVGRPAPDFSLPNGYGGRLELQSFRGQPVLLVFWATWCGICQREMPLLSEMAPQFENAGISMVAVHLGSQQDAGSFTRANRIDFTSVADPEGKVGQAYHVSGIPALVLIGKDGKIKRESSGWTGESVLRQWINVVGGS